MPLTEIGTRSPSPPFRGEREGPNPQGWEGEVSGAASRHVGPPHPALSPAGGGRGIRRGWPKLSLTEDVERQEGADDEIRHVDQLA